MNGPEGRNVKGDYTENEIEAYFSNFVNWELIYQNIDVRFLNVDKRKDENRGFDFLYKIFEPFEEGSMGIIIESKKVKDKSSFNKKRLAEDIYTLKNKIEKAQSSKDLLQDQKLEKYNIKFIKYGILCYRFNDFDFEHFIKILKEIQIKDTRRGFIFPVIFILANDRFSRFVHLRNKINGPMEFYYPYYGGNKWMLKEEKLSLFYQFSDIIPFESNNEKYILSFDEPSIKSFQYIQDFSTRLNFDVSKIILAKSNHEDLHIYNQLKENWEKEAGKKFRLISLNSDMNCSENLEEVFKNE